MTTNLNHNKATDMALQATWYSVLSLTAGCRRNSPAEKVTIAGWIFGWRSLGKAQHALGTFLEPPQFNLQPAT